MRRAAALLVVFVAVLAVVLAGPGQPAAEATTASYVPAPAPVGLPGSALGALQPVDVTALQQMSQAQASEYLRRTVGSYQAPSAVGLPAGTPVGQTAPVTAPAAKATGLSRVGVPKVGSALAAVSGLQIGWSIGRFACEGTALGELVDCATTEPDPDYTRNPDGVVDTGGWVANNEYQAEVTTGTSTAFPGALLVRVTLASAPAWREPAPTSVTFTGQAPNSWGSDGRFGYAFRAYCVASTGDPGSPTVGSSGSGASDYVNLGYSWPPVVRQISSCGSGKGIDRLEVGNRTTAGVITYTDVWYPEGHPNRPVPNPDPERTWRTDGTCVQGAQVELVSNSSVPFRESEPEFPQYPDVRCPSGYQLQHLEVHKLTPSLDPPGDEVVYTWDAPEQVRNIGSEYPDCAGGLCVLRLWLIQQNGSRLDCFDAPAACRGWYDVPEPTRSEQYECKYGPYVVPLSDCYVYRPTFGHAADVEAGVEPSAPPYAAPGGELPPAEPTPDPGAGDGTCPPEAGFLEWLNPFWLFDTLKCALVPSQAGLRAGWDAANIDWCSTAAGVLTCSVEQVLGPFLELGAGDDSDCRGARIVIPEVGMLADRPGEMEYYPFQACSAPTTTISDFWIGLSSGVTYLGAFLLGGQMLARTIGADDAVPA